MSRKNTKRIKKGKGEIIQELQLVALGSLKRSRDVQTKNEELERSHVALERENHRLTLLVKNANLQVEAERMRWLPSWPLVASPNFWSISQPDLQRTFCDDMYDDLAISQEKMRTHDVTTPMDIATDWL